MPGRRGTTIRNQILAAFTLITLLAVLVTSGVSVWINLRYARLQAFDRLTAVADLQTLAIESWLYGLGLDLDTLLTSPYELDTVKTVTAQNSLLNPQHAQDYLRDNFGKMVARTQRFEEVFLLNLNGEVVVSTTREQERKFLDHERYFERGKEAFYVQPPYYDVTGRINVFVARPAFDQLGNLVGVLVGRVNLTQLNDILAQRTILGKTEKLTWSHPVMCCSPPPCSQNPITMFTARASIRLWRRNKTAWGFIEITAARRCMASTVAAGVASGLARRNRSG
jgi:hypothetical protein